MASAAGVPVGILQMRNVVPEIRARDGWLGLTARAEEGQPVGMFQNYLWSSDPHLAEIIGAAGSDAGIDYLKAHCEKRLEAARLRVEKIVMGQGGPQGVEPAEFG